MREISTPSVLISFGVVALVAVLFHEPEVPAASVAEVPQAPRAEAKRRTSRVSLAGESSGHVPLTRASERSVRTDFTTVLPHENLAAVADRVYGTRDVTSSLWKANRDQLERPESLLREGTLLRTPAME